MRLYPKKLRSIEDLEREKKLLQKESRRMEEEDFLSLDDLFKTSGKEEGGIGPLLDFVPVSNPIVGVLVKLVQQRLSKKENNPDTEDTAHGAKKKRGKNPLKALALEFIGGYLKWKAIELSYKGIRHVIKKRKEKKAASQ